MDNRKTVCNMGLAKVATEKILGIKSRSLKTAFL